MINTLRVVCSVVLAVILTTILAFTVDNDLIVSLGSAAIVFFLYGFLIERDGKKISKTFASFLAINCFNRENMLTAYKKPHQNKKPQISVLQLPKIKFFLLLYRISGVTKIRIAIDFWFT